MPHGLGCGKRSALRPRPPKRPRRRKQAAAGGCARQPPPPQRATARAASRWGYPLRNAQRARAEDAGGCVLGRRHYIYTTSRRAKTYGLSRSCRYRNAAASALGRRTSKSTPQRARPIRHPVLTPRVRRTRSRAMQVTRHLPRVHVRASRRPRRAHAASLHVRLRRPLPGLRAERRLLRAIGGHLLLQQPSAPFLWSSPGRIIAPSSRAVAFCGSYPRRVWAPFYSAGGSGSVGARSPAAIRASTQQRSH